MADGVLGYINSDPPEGFVLIGSDSVNVSGSTNIASLEIISIPIDITKYKRIKAYAKNLYIYCTGNSMSIQSTIQLRLGTSSIVFSSWWGGGSTAAWNGPGALSFVATIDNYMALSTADKNGVSEVDITENIIGQYIDSNGAAVNFSPSTVNIYISSNTSVGQLRGYKAELYVYGSER